MSTQFQLGLELTNIVNPLSQAVSALGSLALVDAIQKAGSDVITEMRLASLIGRHKIDRVIAWHFRKAVGKADQTIISRYMDIVLESGSGPTVQEAIKNPALFSMVIQLSALTFAHEDESLANAIVKAIEKIVRESQERLEIVPDYVSLLGTLRACQQQTAAFSWAPLYESVERKLLDAVKASEIQPTIRNKRSSKRQKVDKPGVANAACLNNRSLPFPVLQCLLMWVQSLQSFPEHRLLQLRCHTGISTAVVWCHHILGLAVTVCLQGSTVLFNGEPGSGSVLIEESNPQQAGASLMNPADQHEPLFSFLNDDNDPSISNETRAEAAGYGLLALKQTGLTAEEIRSASIWITARTMSFIDQARTSKFTHFYPDAPKAENREWEHYWLDSGLPNKDQLMHAATFFFSLNHLDLGEIESSIDPPKKPPFKKSSNWPTLVAILVAFARIREVDLEKCRNMPLSLSACRKLDKFEHGLAEDLCDSQPPDVIVSFEVLSRLLLGHVYTDEYINPAVLVSAWGWSIFFESINADDPIDVPINTIRIECGVPARHGLRKTRIIDGPTDVSMSSITNAKTLSKDPQICYFPGVSTAEKGVTLVGQHSDAFQITQTFEWKSINKVHQKHKLGFRNMQELCSQADRFYPCTHEDNLQSFHEWIDKRTNDLHGGELRPTSVTVSGGSCLFFEGRWPKDDAARSSSMERVLVGMRSTNYPLGAPIEALSAAMGSAISTDIWFFYVSKNPAARWLQLYDLITSCEGGAFSLVIRSRDTCVECAANDALSGKKKPVLVLL